MSISSRECNAEFGVFGGCLKQESGRGGKEGYHVASNVSSMSAVARESVQGAGQVNQASTDLARMASKLKGIVNQFSI